MVWGTYRFWKHTTLQNGKKWPEKKCPRVPGWVGGVQSLFEQCPDVGGIKRNGCSLTAVLPYVLVWQISWIILHILACTCCREYYTQQFKLIVHFYPKYKIFPRLNQHGKKWHGIKHSNVLKHDTRLAIQLTWFGKDFRYKHGTAADESVEHYYRARGWSKARQRKGGASTQNIVSHEYIHQLKTTLLIQCSWTENHCNNNVGQ